MNKNKLSSDYRTDYVCWMFFSIMSGFYLIFPIFFYDAYGFSRVLSSYLSFSYLVGLLIGALSYTRLLKHLIKKWPYPSISPDRFLLGCSGVFVTAILIVTSYLSNYKYLLPCLMLLGIFSSSFSSLNMSIMNSNTHDVENKAHHAAKQRWYQNIGISILFVIFGFWKGDHYNIFYLLGAITFIVSCAEILLAKINASPSVEDTGPINKDCNSSIAMGKFFIYVTLSLIVFMQIPNVFAYYLKDYYSIGFGLFAKLMLINEVIVILSQFYIANVLIDKVDTKHSFSIGLSLIGCGVVLPVILSGMLSVVISFILWTVGEIVLFTTIRLCIMKYSNSNKSNNVSLAVRYYTIFYLSGISSPILLWIFPGDIGIKTLLILLFFFSIFLACLWQTFNFNKS